MERTITLKKSSVAYKAIGTVCAIAASVILPQIFHLIGAASGLGTTVGAAFLPMHIPVIIAGFLCGPVVGVIAGALSPIISAALTGMPVGLMVPIMVAELAAYGLFAGMLKGTKLPDIVSLLITMVGGRAVRLAAVAFIIYALGNTSLTLISVWTAVVAGLPGIVIQLVLIPLVLYRVKGIKKTNE